MTGIDARPGTTDYTAQLRDEIAALFRGPANATRLGDEPPGVIADVVLSVVGPELLRWKAAGLRSASGYTRSRSADRTFDKASVSTALCTVSAELNHQAATIEQEAIA